MIIIFYVVASSSPVLSTSNTLESIKDYARSLLKLLPEHTVVSPETQESDLHSLSSDKLGSPSSSRSGDSGQEENNVAMMNGNGNCHETVMRHQTGKQATKKARTIRVDDLRWTELENEKVAEGGLTGCREAVEILTRNPKKGTYDRGNLTQRGLTVNVSVL